MRGAELLVAAIVAGVTMLLVGTAFHFAVPMLAPDLSRHYENTALFRDWAGWTSTYMLVHPLWFGVVFAFGYRLMVHSSALKKGWRGGIKYGAGLFLMGSLPVFLLAFASVRLPVEILFAWSLQNLAQYVAAGFVLGVMPQSALTADR